MMVDQIRTLALFEFIDTSFFTDWLNGVLGIEEEVDDEDFCDVEVEDCDEIEEIKEENLGRRLLRLL